MSTVNITPPPLSPQSMADLLCTIIILCHARHPDGKPFWAYMCVKPSMARAFKEARDSGVCNIEDFGTIIEIGEGHTVPPEVMHRMEDYYGVNHNYEMQLLRVIEELKCQDA